MRKAVADQLPSTLYRLERGMENVIKIIGITVLGLCGIMFFGLLFAFPTMLSWNYTMPYLFGLKTITWQQVWCLSFLSGMFIKLTLSSK